MVKRLLSGIFYILVLAEFILLRYVHIAFFDALVVIFCILGAFEMLRAFKHKMDMVQKCIVALFAPAVIICFSACDILFKSMQETDPEVVNYAAYFTFAVFMAAVAILMSLLVLRHEETTLESTGYALMSLLYPSVFLLILVGCNHMPQYSEIGLLFVFVICPFSDCFAFVFGKLFGRRLPEKMAPQVSPNKTVIGGIGGILGGAIGAAVIFFVYFGLIYQNELEINTFNLIFFVALGILTAVFTELGDLVESGIKRRLAIKDMGDLLPGHGGILDRIDSALYASLVVCFAVVVRIMIVG